MKGCVSEITIVENLLKFAKQMDGVFSLADLCQIIGSPARLVQQRMIAKLIDAKIILRWQREIYSVKSFDPWLLAQRLNPNGYISMNTVLSKNGLTGSITKQIVNLVVPNRNRCITKHQFVLNLYHLSPPLYFGFEVNAKGIRVADNEKAFLDLLYFRTRGYRFAVDPMKDVNLKKINQKILFQYLRNYRNPKFQIFVERIFNGK